jgi:hypothetical protein
MGSLLDLAIGAAMEKPSGGASAVGSEACLGYDGADPVVRARLLKVAQQLRDRPDQRLATDVIDAPLKRGSGAPVSVVLAVRTAAGIVAGELQVPRERFDPALFLRTLTETSETPS